MLENNDENRWPQPPKDKDGVPRPWVVATLAFNNAACLGINAQGSDWHFKVAKREDDARPCFLMGYFDEDYSSFHVDRCFLDGERERIYNPSQSARPVDYKRILDLMQLWQENARLNQWQEQEVIHLSEMSGFDPLLYRPPGPPAAP